MNVSWETMQDLLNSWWFMRAELDKMTEQLEALGCTWENGSWVYSPELEARLNAADARRDEGG